MKKLSKNEMKKIMAGEGDVGGESRCYNSFTHCNVDGTLDGNCESRTDGRCVCNNGKHSIISSDCLK